MLNTIKSIYIGLRVKCFEYFWSIYFCGKFGINDCINYAFHKYMSPIFTQIESNFHPISETFLILVASDT